MLAVLLHYCILLLKGVFNKISYLEVVVLHRHTCVSGFKLGLLLAPWLLDLAHCHFVSSAILIL